MSVVSVDLICCVVLFHTARYIAMHCSNAHFLLKTENLIS